MKVRGAIKIVAKLHEKMGTMLVDQASVRSLLVSAIPDWEWLLGEIESEKGWFRFPPFLSNAITNLKIENYPLLYQDEPAIATVFLRAFLTPDEIKELDAELIASSPEERGEFLLGFANAIDASFDKADIPKTPAEQDAARKKFELLSEEERSKANPLMFGGQGRN